MTNNLKKIPFGPICQSLINGLLVCVLIYSLPVHAASRELFLKAVDQMKHKDFAGATNTLQQLEGTSYHTEEVTKLLTAALLAQGHQRISSGDYDIARELFHEARRYNENEIESWLGEAMAWFIEGKYQEAAWALIQALGIDAENPDIYFLLGKTYYADGQMVEALDALRMSQQFGSTEALSMLEKVQREWQIEKDMEKETTGHFHVSFIDGNHQVSLADEILETLETAYVDLGSDLAFFPDVRIPVLLYSQQDYQGVTRSPSWAGAVYDGKIRLPLASRHEMTSQMRSILYHEYMHVLVHFMTKRPVPVWLNEGLAEMAGRRIVSRPHYDLAENIASKGMLEWDVLERPFAHLAEEKVLQAYEQSFSIVYFMVESYGWHKITELLLELQKGQEWESAVKIVYNDYGLDWAAMQKEWLKSLN